MYRVIDFVTKTEVKPHDLVFAGEKNPWEVIMDLELVEQKINKDYFQSALPKLAKYLPLMPIRKPSAFVTLRENATPLIKSKHLGPELGIELYFKLEGKNPTGSFKDRGSAVDISVAKELGAPAVILASTGNMAASCSCYAAAANLPCYVVVPEDVAMSKLAQVISYGGKIIQVKGNYNDAAALAHEIAKTHGFYLAGDYAFRVEGQKTAAFEIVDQLLLQVPDVIVIPIGCGTNITAYAKGFAEYQQLGFIEHAPQLVGVQSTGANAVVNSFRQGLNTIEKLSHINTIASAIAVPDPIDGLKALDAIRHSGGEAFDVTDAEILHAQYLLSTREGLFVETASAATLAYLLKKLPNKKLVGKTIVCVLTGDGLKDANVLLKFAIKPPLITPTLQDFDRLYEHDFFISKTMIFTQTDKTLLSEIPTQAEFNALLLDVFGVHYEECYLQNMHRIACDMLRKGKALTLADLQDVVQNALEQVNINQEPVFTIEDFDVATIKNQQAHATVTVKLNQRVHTGSGYGVGPVDAAINALANACQAELDFKLKDYKVDIRHHGTDAVVYVEMKLARDGDISLGKAASPDIIQASLSAFEVAYNGLFKN
ncbi:MAG: hypothetical protein Tsb005_00930 [Gammaproteobacteria bacterium]